MTQKIDCVGDVYGKLTVLGDAPKTSANRRVYVRCECGTEKSVLLGSLRSGRTVSCGCVHKETVRTHGQSRSGNKLYRVWASMKSRCNDPNNANYHGRGISVCEAWQTFEPFHTWALSHGYKDGLSIDRRDNSKGYSPDNCWWTDNTNQSRNRRSAANSSSQYIGVYLCAKRQKWVAQIRVDKVTKTLGLHETELEAAITRERYILDNNLTGFTLNHVLTGP